MGNQRLCGLSTAPQPRRQKKAGIIVGFDNIHHPQEDPGWNLRKIAFDLFRCDSQENLDFDESDIEKELYIIPHDFLHHNRPVHPYRAHLGQVDGGSILTCLDPLVLFGLMIFQLMKFQDSVNQFHSNSEFDHPSYSSRHQALAPLTPATWPIDLRDRVALMLLNAESSLVGIRGFGASGTSNVS